MPIPLRFLVRGTLLVAGAAVVLSASAATEQQGDAPTLVDAQRKMRQTGEQLERAERDVSRAQRSLRQAQEDLQAAEREVERKRTGVEEAKKGVAEADGKLSEAKRQHEAARAAIEKLYDAQQR